MSTGKMIIGALAGLTTGAVLAILFAPDSGANTRKKIANKRKDTVDGIKNKYNDIVEGITIKLESAKTDAMRIFEKQKSIAGSAGTF